MSETKQAHDRIWLQDGCDDPECGDGRCGLAVEVTWCEDRINDHDSEYLLATPVRKSAHDLLAVLTDMTALAAGPAGGVSQSQKREIIERARAAIRAATGEP